MNGHPGPAGRGVPAGRARRGGHRDDPQERRRTPGSRSTSRATAGSLRSDRRRGRPGRAAAGGPGRPAAPVDDRAPSLGPDDAQDRSTEHPAASPGSAAGAGGTDRGGPGSGPFIVIGLLLAIVVGGLAFIAWQRGPRTAVRAGRRLAGRRRARPPVRLRAAPEPDRVRVHDRTGRGAARTPGPTSRPWPGRRSRSPTGGVTSATTGCGACATPSAGCGSPCSGSSSAAASGASVGPAGADPADPPRGGRAPSLERAGPLADSRLVLAADLRGGRRRTRGLGLERTEVVGQVVGAEDRPAGDELDDGRSRSGPTGTSRSARAAGRAGSAGPP